MLPPIQRRELAKICNSILFDISISSYTTFKVGGNVEALCDVREMKELIELVRYLYKKDIPYAIIGNGSNVLVSDTGFDGVIVRLKGKFEKIDKPVVDDKGVVLNIGAGATIPQLLRYCIKNGLGGAEFLAGIPGTIGGATAMNAGAFGEEIGKKIDQITMVTAHGDLVSKKGSELRFSYRDMHIQPGSIITGVWLRLNHSDTGIVKKRISEHLRIRSQSQPLNYPSAGCIFKNPEGHKAGKLIDEVGLKGKSRGGAMISQRHANFIINTGNAKTADIMALIRIIREEIKEKKGIELEPEIRFIGFG